MNSRSLKIVIFAIVVIILCTVVYFSKQYFDSNYNSHQAVESNLNLYRIKMNEKQESEQEDSNAQIVKEEQVEVHPEVTQVVEPEAAPAPATSQTIQQTPTKPVQPVVKPATAQPKAIDTKPAATKTATQVTTTQPVVKPVTTQTNTAQPTQKPLTVSPKTEAKPANGTSTISKPKTLEEKPTVTQTVMKSPEFQTFVIQVGAFSTKVEAELMKARVSRIPAVSKFRVEVKHYPEKNLFKVLVEYFETAEIATQVCGELKQNNVQCFTTKI